MEGWSFLTNHAQVLLCIAHDPGVRLRDIAASLGITERSAHGIITDLTTAGYTVKQKTAAATATRSRPTCPCESQPARNLPSAKSSLSSPARDPLVTGQRGRVTLTPAASASQSCKLPEPAGRQHAAACADPDGLWHWPARHRATRLVTLTLVASAARAGRCGRSARSPAAFGATVIGSGWPPSGHEPVKQ
jgi:IclR-like helix-turn-helix domain-containing protein